MVHEYIKIPLAQPCVIRIDILIFHLLRFREWMLAILSKNLAGDFGKADAIAPNGPADYDNNTWHHHQNGTTMQEVPKNIHSEFTHRGGVSTILWC